MNRTLATLEEHSFSDEVASRVVSMHSDYEVVHCNSIVEVQRMVEQKEADGILPIENASGGLVVPHLDWLRGADVEILMDVRHRINMCAGVLPGYRNPKRAYSHGKGLDQCARYLAKIHGIEQVPCASTVEAVRTMKEANDVDGIVLASRGAIVSMGLDILKEDVANHRSHDNITQFYLVRKNGAKLLPNPDAHHHALMVEPKNKIGALRKLLSIFDNAQLDMTSIHSRPVNLKQYEFFLEMARVGTPKQLKLCAEQLEEDPEVRSVRWLGSWDVQLNPDD